MRRQGARLSMMRGAWEIDLEREKAVDFFERAASRCERILLTNFCSALHRDEIVLYIAM
jgi:hypothetical protein